MVRVADTVGTLEVYIIFLQKSDISAIQKIPDISEMSIWDVRFWCCEKCFNISGKRRFYMLILQWNKLYYRN